MSYLFFIILWCGVAYTSEALLWIVDGYALGHGTFDDDVGKAYLLGGTEAVEV